MAVKLEDMLDMQTVMTKLDLRRKSVMRLITSGKLDAHKVGQQWRFKPSDVTAFLDRVKFRAVQQHLQSQPRRRAPRSSWTSTSSQTSNRYM